MKKRYRYMLLVIAICLLFIGLHEIQKNTPDISRVKPNVYSNSKETSQGYQREQGKKRVLTTVKEYQEERAKIVKKTQNIHLQWITLLESTAFEDLCNEVYAQEFENLGVSFIEEYIKFVNLEVEGKEETEIEEYQLYLSYFISYRHIGETLYDLADTIRNGEYQEAKDDLQTLRELVLKIPLIK